jgi:hypothetical protein
MEGIMVSELSAGERDEGVDRTEGGDTFLGHDGAVTIRYTLVEPRVRGVLPMIRPLLVSIRDEDGEGEGGEEHDNVVGDTNSLPDPWRAVDGFMKVRKPSWSFAVSERWPEEVSHGGARGIDGADRLMLSRPPQPLDPNYDFIRPRVAGIPRFATFLNLRCFDRAKLISANTF